ncbi:hypothetical protein Vadar_029672 [Vaccinium darrowii]|uniref:Uncharacterized protein n=1 Tax=Vaccinium darrowii TaxID=229202 RepID=A0ACB7ZNM5_9ERIC|nr:hypothetical protein Vadar_029672 [Vaccinium darrowii]
MESTASEIVTHEFPPYFRVYKGGRIERFKKFTPVPVTIEPKTGVEIKDVSISPKIKARIFKPKMDGPDQKLPLVVHYHGGAFCVGSPFDATTLVFLSSLASEAKVIALSVDYRLAPENKLPIAFDDSWSALQWISTHSKGDGPNPWLNDYVDFNRIFLMGESAGATIAHQVAVRAGSIGLDGFRIHGLILAHPYFADHEPDKLILFLYPESCGTEADPRLNPKSDPDLVKMVCSKVFVCVADKDWFKSRGVTYCGTLKCIWKGDVEFVETEGTHCFHVFNPTSEEAGLLRQRLGSFINQA